MLYKTQYVDAEYTLTERQLWNNILVLNKFFS